MNTNLDLKQTERNSFKLATYSDGLADISLGLVMILLSLYPYTREVFGVAVNILFFFAVLGTIIWLQVKFKGQLGPDRIGLVNFGEKAQKRMKIAVLITSLLVFLTAVTWYLSSQGYMLPKGSIMGTFGFDILLAVIILAIFSAMAYALELTRYYFYGFLLAFAFMDIVPASLKDVTIQLPLGIAGLIIVAIGVALLVRFLDKYPTANAEEGLDNGRG
jgi:hypothetical protein